jgi:hypothetical protein
LLQSNMHGSIAAGHLSFIVANVGPISNAIARKMSGKDPVVGEIQNSSHFP